MDNNKRNVHTSGPLGMLMKTGQVKRVDDSEHKPLENAVNNTGGSYFKTQAGIEFSEQELLFVDPKECEPWQYANRQADELGDMDELVESIKSNKQLQPALIRIHPKPHDGIKYEIIFGRRRHLACLRLGVPFLAIRKDIQNVQDAIASQDAENKLRNDVSDYSNAKLYQRLLLEGVFTTEKQLAAKLQLSSSSLNDLMAYAKIPDDIVEGISDIHHLSKSIAIKIVQLLNKSKDNHAKLLLLAPQLGKSITSSAKLDQVLEKLSVDKVNESDGFTKLYKAISGEKLFTFKMDTRGLPCVVINKEIAGKIDVEKMCEHISKHLEEQIV